VGFNNGTLAPSATDKDAVADDKVEIAEEKQPKRV
jgi:hypothetical protein